MARISGTPATHLDSAALRRIHLVKLDFASGAACAHDGVGSFTYDGDTYEGVGELGGVEAVTEDIAVRPQTVTLSLTGVDAALLADVLDDDYHRRDALIYLQVLDAELQAVSDPVLIWSGKMDSVSIELAEGSATISLRCMDRLSDLDRPRAVWLTDEAQQRRYSGDVGLEFSPQAARETTVTWGSSQYSSPAPGGDPGGGDWYLR